MKAKFIKTFNGKKVISVERNVQDSSELYNFLTSVGFKISLQDCSFDFKTAKEVTYTLPLVDLYV